MHEEGHWVSHSTQQVDTYMPVVPMQTKHGVQSYEQQWQGASSGQQQHGAEILAQADRCWGSLSLPVQYHNNSDKPGYIAIIMGCNVPALWPLTLGLQVQLYGH